MTYSSVVTITHTGVWEPGTSSSDWHSSTRGYGVTPMVAQTRYRVNYEFIGRERGVNQRFTLWARLTTRAAQTARYGEQFHCRARLDERTD